jgi:hypothetical protein
MVGLVHNLYLSWWRLRRLQALLPAASSTYLQRLPQTRVIVVPVAEGSNPSTHPTNNKTLPLFRPFGHGAYMGLHLTLRSFVAPCFFRCLKYSLSF